ncbi:hypothetical protein ABW20_dc0107720 [Dactylellina cionopaga]|nr:hypothetical protein ABW20_dc0107720 [Dactylellina cionopaga]
MHFSKSTFALAAIAGASTVSAITGSLGDAPVTQGNSIGILYEANLASAEVEGAYLNFTGTSDGVGVLVTACFQGINGSQPGPYPYHIHTFATPADDNCTATGPHLDPYLRNDTVSCDKTAPQTCQVGDLAGKHGAIPSDATGRGHWCTTYVDNYLSLDPNDKAFIGNSRSIVVHNSNKTRLACGDIVLITRNPVYPNSNATITGTGAPPSPPTETGGSATTSPAVVANGAAQLGASSLALGVILGLGALFL